MKNTKEPPAPICLVLAAGQSTRFGSQKLLHQMPNGTAMILNTLDKVKEVFGNAYLIVLDADQLELQILLGGKNTVLVNTPVPEMSTSLKTGLRASIEASAWLVVLADMPYIKIETLRKLKEQMHADRITVPTMLGQRGNPVSVGRKFIDDLLNLNGDHGAKKLINKYSESCLLLDVTDEGILKDVDKLEDLNN